MLHANDDDEIRRRKCAIRREAFARRLALDNKDQRSKQILARVMELPEYHKARTIMCYMHIGSEVRTRQQVSQLLAGDKRVTIPYCQDGELELFRLKDMEELAPRTLGILEPKAEQRTSPAKRVKVEQLDLILVPGVAFDRRGARTGHGHGYYDRLLRRVPERTRLVGVCFECQMFDEVPVADHDVFMDKVVTESALYLGRGRRPTRREVDG